MENFFKKGKLAIVGLTLCLTFTGGILNAQQINVGYLVDVSQSVHRIETYNAKQALGSIVQRLDLPNSKAGVTLRSSVVGAAGIPPINTTVLSKAGYFSSVQDRKNNLAQFLQQGLADLEALDQPHDHQHTQLYRSLVALVKGFDPSADRTLIIIDSDFVESGPVFEFLHYKRKPAQLLADFEKIMEAFQADHPFPNLRGTEVILVSPADTELALFAVRFWEKAMTYFGAKKVAVQTAL